VLFKRLFGSGFEKRFHETLRVRTRRDRRVSNVLQGKKANLENDVRRRGSELQENAGRGNGADGDRVRGGGHGGRRHVHPKLRPVQEDVGRVFRGTVVRGRLRQVQGQDDTGLREHRFRGAVPQQTRIIRTLNINTIY